MTHDKVDLCGRLHFRLLLGQRHEVSSPCSVSSVKCEPNRPLLGRQSSMNIRYNTTHTAQTTGRKGREVGSFLSCSLIPTLAALPPISLAFPQIPSRSLRLWLLMILRVQWGPREIRQVRVCLRTHSYSDWNTTTHSLSLLPWFFVLSTV